MEVGRRITWPCPLPRIPWGGWGLGMGRRWDVSGRSFPPAYPSPRSCRGASRPLTATCPTPDPAPPTTTWQPWPPHPLWVSKSLLPSPALGGGAVHLDTSLGEGRGSKTELQQREGLQPRGITICSMPGSELESAGSSDLEFPPPRVRRLGPPEALGPTFQMSACCGLSSLQQSPPWAGR